MKKNLLITLMLMMMSIVTAQADGLIAFPGADGYGKYTTGGRGGKVYYVTRNDDCPDNNLVKGTLRWALQDGDDTPRTILFETSGVIYLTSKLSTKHPNVSILGQTAPGGGICIAGYNIYINKNNYIVRYLRFRAGDIPNTSMPGLQIENAQNVIVDHCSITWSMEESLTAYDTDYTTIQWSIIGEGLYNSKNAKGARAYAMQWGGEHSTMHHTLITNSYNRSPRFNGVRNTSTGHDFQVDSEFANNVIFNWGQIHGGEYNTEINNQSWYAPANPGYNRVYLINNYYRAGPCTVSRKDKATCFTTADAPYGEWYLNGNKFETGGTFSSQLDQSALAAKNNDNFDGLEAGSDYRMSTIPYALSGLEYESAEQAYNNVIGKAGCSLPRYDEVDTRLLEEAAGIRNPEFVGPTLAAAGTLGIIDSPDDITLQNHDTYTVDGVQYTNYPFIGMQNGDKYIVDTDCDGMPDAYEEAKEFNKNNASDGAATASNGYTNLENYLNGIADGTLNKADYETSEVQVPSGEAGNVPASITVTFSCSDSNVDGNVPAPLVQSYASSFTIPTNTSLYKDGYTLTAWKNGSTTYSLGSQFVGTEDCVLTPVFTANSESIYAGKDDYTITWDFTATNAPKLGTASGIYVTQAELSTITADAPLWYNGATITVPASLGATVKVYDGSTTTTYKVTENVTTKDIALTNPSDVESVTVVLPFKADPSATYHTPVCAEGTSYEILLTPGDAFTSKPDWVKAKYSDATRTCYDPDADDKSTTKNLQSCILKGTDTSYMDIFVTGTERVRLFISGSATASNIMTVKVVPNDGSGSKTLQNTGIAKNVPGLIDIDLDKTKSYQLHLTAATEATQIAIGAIKLFESTALPINGKATIAWPLSGGSLAISSINPDGYATATATMSDELRASAGSKTGGAQFVPTTERSAASSAQVITFVGKPAKGISINPTKLTLKSAKIGTDKPKFNITIQYGNGEEKTVATAQDGNKGSSKDFSYDLTYGATTEPITVRIYPYAVSTNKAIEFAAVALTGTYEGTPEINYYTLTTAANPAEGGNVGVNPSSGSIAEGTTVTLSASENSDYLFTGWTTESGATYSTDATISFTMESDMNLTANFKALSEYTDIFKENSPYDAEVKNVEELKVALKAAAKRSNLTKRYRIFLHNATYDLGTTVKTAIPAYTSIIGESMDGTLIVNTPAASTLTSTNRADVTPTLFIDQNQNEVYIQDVTIRNAIDWESKTSTGQALAMRQRGKHTIYKKWHCKAYRTHTTLTRAMQPHILRPALSTALQTTSMVTALHGLKDVISIISATRDILPLPTRRTIMWVWCSTTVQLTRLTPKETSTSGVHGATVLLPHTSIPHSTTCPILQAGTP